MFEASFPSRLWFVLCPGCNIADITPGSIGLLPGRCELLVLVVWPLKRHFFPRKPGTEWRWRVAHVLSENHCNLADSLSCWLIAWGLSEERACDVFFLLDLHRKLYTVIIRPPNNNATSCSAAERTPLPGLSPYQLLKRCKESIFWIIGVQKYVYRLILVSLNQGLDQMLSTDME